MTTATTRSLLLVPAQPCYIEHYVTEDALPVGTADPTPFRFPATSPETDALHWGSGLLSQHLFPLTAYAQDEPAIQAYARSWNTIPSSNHLLMALNSRMSDTSRRKHAWKDVNRCAYDITRKHSKIFFALTG